MFGVFKATLDPALIYNVHQVLKHLYDPAKLRVNPLVHLLKLDPHEEVATALRRILIDSIKAIKPEQDMPLHSNEWRYYQILFQRYVEQFLQNEVATDLSLSLRQLRRQEKAAVEHLSIYLWRHHILSNEVSEQTSVMSKTDQKEAMIDENDLTLRQELEWTHKSLPSGPARVEEIISSVLHIVRPLIETFHVRVEVNLPDDLPHPAVQRVTLQQALLNALSASIYSAAGDTLCIEATTNGHEVCIRLSPAGLAGELGGEEIEMMEELVEFSGGRLEVNHRSGGEKQDSCICFILPIETKLRVLAIDDNPDTLKLLQRYLSGSNYQMIEVQDPKQALAIAEKVDPHIVSLDVMLPEIDGWELLGRLREHPKIRETPILVCTVLPQEQLALALGASAFLRKPLSRTAFLTALNAQVDLLRRKGVHERLNRA